MKLSEIKDKLKAAGVEDSIISAVEGLDNSAEVERLAGELTAEKGKNAGILEDKRKFKADKEAAEAKLAEIENSKLSATELADKQKAELEEKLAGFEKQLQEKDAAYAAEKREASIAKIAASLKPASGIDSSTINTLVKTRLTDVEDLSDDVKVSEVVNSLKETNKALFAAEVPAGSGGKQESGGGGGDDNNTPTTAGAVSAAWGK